MPESKLTTINISNVPAELRGAIVQEAHKNSRSIAAEVRVMLGEQLAARRATRPGRRVPRAA